MTLALRLVILETVGGFFMKKKTHHDMCGACEKVPLEYTPEEFPQPGEIAERILSKNPDWARLHYMISMAISRRDKLWREYNDTN